MASTPGPWAAGEGAVGLLHALSENFTDLFKAAFYIPNSFLDTTVCNFPALPKDRQGPYIKSKLPASCPTRPPGTGHTQSSPPPIGVVSSAAWAGLEGQDPALLTAPYRGCSRLERGASAGRSAE